MNGKVRVMTKRGYGFRDPRSLIALTRVSLSWDCQITIRRSGGLSTKPSGEVGEGCFPVGAADATGRRLVEDGGYAHAPKRCVLPTLRGKRVKKTAKLESDLPPPHRPHAPARASLPQRQALPELANRSSEPPPEAPVRRSHIVARCVARRRGPGRPNGSPRSKAEWVGAKRRAGTASNTALR
jgi:hypothetical protein